MKLVAQNITLENVKKSDYWNLISILVWNHYSELEHQEESKIKIEESWFGKFPGGGSYSNKWNDPNYSEEGSVRTLNAIVITFEREDYTTYIYLYVDGNINCFGMYSDKSLKKTPHYEGLRRNLDITNWLMKNNFVTATNNN